MEDGRLQGHSSLTHSQLAHTENSLSVSTFVGLRETTTTPRGQNGCTLLGSKYCNKSPSHASGMQAASWTRDDQPLPLSTSFEHKGMTYTSRPHALRKVAKFPKHGYPTSVR